MSTTIDSNAVNKNIENVKSLLPNKVVITSRNTYLTKNIEKNFIHDSNVIEILDFDNQNIDEFVNNKFKNNKIGITQSELYKILEKPDIKKFTHKPLFLQIICDKHSEFQNRAITNPAVIFEILTNEWIIHDVNKNPNLDENKKDNIKNSRHRISESLAYFSNGLGSTNSVSNEAISITEIQQQVDKEFKLERKSKIDVSELRQFYHDAQNSTFLIKEASENNNDTYSFLHKSIIEYFVARRIVTLINENFYEDKSEYILSYSQQIKTPETFEFIEYITEIEWKINHYIYDKLYSPLEPNEISANIKTRLDRERNFYDTIQYFKQRSINEDPKTNPDIGNLVSILYSTTDFAKFSFKQMIKDDSSDQSINFSKCNLNHVNMPESNLSHSNLTQSAFKDANLYNSDLSYSDLSYSYFRDADLSYTDLSHATVSKTDFRDATLPHIDFSESNLSYATIAECECRYSNISNAKLNHAILRDSTFCYSNLSNSDLSHAIC